MDGLLWQNFGTDYNIVFRRWGKVIYSVWAPRRGLVARRTANITWGIFNEKLAFIRSEEELAEGILKESEGFTCRRLEEQTRRDGGIEGNFVG